VDDVTATTTSTIAALIITTMTTTTTTTWDEPARVDRDHRDLKITAIVIYDRESDARR
jgi:hypothetical protein